MCASNNSLISDTGFMCQPIQNNTWENCAFPIKIMLDFFFNVQNPVLHCPNPITAIAPNRGI